MPVPEQAPPLGWVVRLEVTPDAAAGTPDDLLRDRLEFEIVARKLQLPSDVDMQAELVSARTSHERVVKALQEGRETLSKEQATDLDFAVLATAMLPKASSSEGGLFAGYRWRLVRRAAVDQSAYLAEAGAVALRYAQWLR